VVKKVENEEFEPYFVENGCFLNSLKKAYFAEKNLKFTSIGFLLQEVLFGDNSYNIAPPAGKLQIPF